MKDILRIKNYFFRKDAWKPQNWNIWLAFLNAKITTPANQKRKEKIKKKELHANTHNKDKKKDGGWRGVKIEENCEECLHGKVKELYNPFVFSVIWEYKFTLCSEFILPLYKLIIYSISHINNRGSFWAKQIKRLLWS